MTLHKRKRLSAGDSCATAKKVLSFCCSDVKVPLSRNSGDTKAMYCSKLSASYSVVGCGIRETISIRVPPATQNFHQMLQMGYSRLDREPDESA